MSVRAVPIAKRPTSPYWVAAQMLGVVITMALLVALVLWPKPALHVLWNMVIPVLPAVFLVNPLLWRNVCPIATLNALSGRVGYRALGRKDAMTAWTAGIILLMVMVPARRFLFNSNGPVLALTIAGVLALALLAGVLHERRSGFCNAICPALPVEKLYGQSPLLKIGNPRCADCSLCTPVGCIDLANLKTVAQTIGPDRKRRMWLLTPFGVFAASFPGFIVGYFMLEDGPLSAAWATYGAVMLPALVSYLCVVAVAWSFPFTSRLFPVLLGGLSFGLYYWWAAPSLGEAYGLVSLGTNAVRAIAAALLAVWIWRVWTRRRLLFGGAIS